MLPNDVIMVEACVPCSFQTPVVRIEIHFDALCRTDTLFIEMTNSAMHGCPTADPLCVVQNYHDEVHRVMAHKCCVGAVLTKTGSHLPFFEGLFMTNWAERVTFEFLDAFLASERAKQSVQSEVTGQAK